MTSDVCPVCGNATVAADIVMASGTLDPVTSLALAGWWRRVGATITDDLILFLPYDVVLAFFSAVIGAYLGAAIAIGLQGIYFVKLLLRERAQTIGNRVADTKVVDATTGGRITNRQAWRRWGFIAIYQLVALVGGAIGFYIATIVILIDWFLPLLDKRKQTLHDKFANTLVVRN